MEFLQHLSNKDSEAFVKDKLELAIKKNKRILLSLHVQKYLQVWSEATAGLS